MYKIRSILSSFLMKSNTVLQKHFFVEFTAYLTHSVLTS